MTTPINFDDYADSYERALGEALSASGEEQEYFAHGRVGWLAACLDRMKVTPHSLMDYGCGTGSTAPLLLEILNAETLVGVDTSLGSLAVARKLHSSSRTDFVPITDYSPAGSVDLAYCNGVFHHIPPGLRENCLRVIYGSLRPGGLFSLWENNPWNPGTRYIMAHCAFDRDAITLTPIDARALLRSGGFEILRTDYLFVFPHFLKALRPIEKLISRVPLGAQYHILGRKPART